MDELLQLRGFLRRQRHADSGASRPPQTMQARSPSSRTLSISGGRSTKRRGGAIASDRAGREPGCRGGTTNCFQTVRTDRHRGCPPTCLIGAVHRAISSGISRPHARSPRPRVSVPHLRPGKGSRPRAGGLFPRYAQAERRPPEGPEGPRQVTCSASCARVCARAPAIFPPIVIMFVPCGESVPDLTNFTLLMVSIHLSLALSPSRPGKRHLVLGEPGSCCCFWRLSLSPPSKLACLP